MPRRDRVQVEDEEERSRREGDRDLSSQNVPDPIAQITLIHRIRIVVLLRP